jgi:chromate transporter
MQSPPGGGSPTPGLLLLGAPLAGTASTAAAPAVGLLPLGAFFLKVGSVLYGSGYVLLAFLRGGLVESYGWLTETQLLDAISIGQFTPGPLLSTSTFIGYLLQSWPGAIVATLGVFLPSFIFVLLTHRWVFRMRSSAVLGGFLDAVNATAVGLMAAVVLQLGQAALEGWPAWVIGLGAAAGVLLTRVNPTWWILGGGGLGVLAWAAGWVGG